MTAVTVSAVTARALLRRVAQAQSSGRVPSLVAGVLRGDELGWTGSWGDVTGGPPVGPDLQYRIGSITKTFTAVRVLQLVEEGALRLETEVGEVVAGVGASDRTLRSLLAHSSGMQSEPVGPWWERSPGVGWDVLAADHAGPLTVLPVGEQFHYSNLAFALLGRVVEGVSGESWWDGVRRRILEPLGMDRTSYLPEGAAAQGYSVDPYAGTLHPEPATDTRAMAPAGQLWSTVEDLATYAAFLLHGDAGVLPLDVLLRASHPLSGDRQDRLEAAHGLGFQLARGGSGMLVGHTGSMPGFLAGLFVDRDRDTAAVMLANATTGVRPQAMVRDLLETLEEQEPTLPEPWRPETGAPAGLAELLGVWHWGNTPFVFALEGGHVVARRNGEVAYSFALEGGRVVGQSGYHTGETLHVGRHPDGTVTHLEVATFVYTREPGPHPSGR